MSINKIFFRKPVLTVILLLAVIVSLVGVSLQKASAAGTGPCDIYASGGTPCVAAHSTTRALFGAYSGRLYQIKRASNGNTTDIGTLAAGGYANAAAQDSFCAGTTCTITIIYDQTSRHNDLFVSGAGGAGAADFPAVANALPISAGGNLVYGVYVSAGVGYRNLAATGTARNGQAEGMYMVASGTHVNDGCCFDYGNTEQPLANDIGNGYMDAVYLGLRCEFGPCTGAGPWVAADLENGLYQGNGSNTANQPVSFNFVTATNKTNGQTTFALKTGNANSGGLTTQYNGTLPTVKSGYIPLKQQGGIVMGVGGDNSRWSTGSFFEGAMTIGQPSDATENAVQANIVAAGYSGDSNGGAYQTITGPGQKCVDVASDDTGVNGTAIQLWDCQIYSQDQHWAYNSADNSFRTLGRCLDIIGNGTANDTQVQLWDCNSAVGGQKWVPQANGSLKNPQSGRCLDSPNGSAANGVRLQIHDCNGAAAQRFIYRGGGAGTGVTFYQDINYGGGGSVVIGQGDYASLPPSVPNDWMSSLRVPAGWTVTAYADGGFAGAVCTFTANTGWVGAGCNDNMSSFKIH